MDPLLAFIPDASEFAALLVTGLLAGALGGLLGIGGSIIMIPVLTLLLHHDQHVSQAAAMIVNIVVALAGTFRHQREYAVPWTSVRRMLPAGLAAIVVGVAVSNRFDAVSLKRIYGAFMLYVIWVNLQRLLHVRAVRRAAEAAGDTPPGSDDHGRDDTAPWIPSCSVGAVTGFAAGLLGIGGGIIAVPLIQRFMGLRLRRAIAASAALMCITAPLGAWRKNMTLASTTDPATFDAGEPLMIAACLGVTAMIGSVLGAGLTHRLPVKWIRAVLIGLLTWAAVRFLGV